MSPVRAQAKPQFAYSQLGNAAAAGLDHDQLSQPSLVPSADVHTQSTSGADWGKCPLLPHHFNFAEGTPVRPLLTTRPDVLCYAVSVIGKGSFQERADADPVSFEKGGIIVKGGERHMFVTLEKFQKHFVLANGNSVEELLQIDYQSPKK